MYAKLINSYQDIQSYYSINYLSAPLAPRQYPCIMVIKTRYAEHGIVSHEHTYIYPEDYGWKGKNSRLY